MAPPPGRLRENRPVAREERRRPRMECFGPECAAMLLEWLKTRTGTPEQGAQPQPGRAAATQELLWKTVPYQEESPVIASAAELAGAIEHLQYAVFRRFENRSDACRADPARQHDRQRSVQDRSISRSDRPGGKTPRVARGRRLAAIDPRGARKDRTLAQPGARAELKLAQLTSLSPETFEEFVAELFEALGYEVEQVGGTGDEGADLRLRRGGLLAIVQCKYHKRVGRGLTRAAKIPGHDSPHAQPQGIFRHHQHVFTCGREICRRSSYRADRWHQAG